MQKHQNNFEKTREQTNKNQIKHKMKIKSDKRTNNHHHLQSIIQTAGIQKLKKPYFQVFGQQTTQDSKIL
jgi:hypothetical protein